MIVISDLQSKFLSVKKSQDEKSLKDFEKWLVSKAVVSDRESVCPVVWDIILRFFEYSSNHLNKSELLDEITDLLSFFTGIQSTDSRNDIVLSDGVDWIPSFIPQVIKPDRFNYTHFNFKYASISELDNTKTLYGFFDRNSRTSLSLT